MARNDWIGLGTSAGVHLALLVLCALLAAGRPETPALGALQLEIGAFAEGRPVQQATPQEDAASASPDEAPDTPQKEPDDAEEQPQPATEEAATPVELPEQDRPPEGDDPPPEQDLPAEKQPEPSPPAAAATDTARSNAPADSVSVADATAETEAESGNETGASTGATTGEEGDENDAEKAAPFDIEGLDRTRLYGGLPSYTEKVNATIKVEIIVGPQGRVVGQRLLQKANPSLERSVMQALRRWRFNRLPAGAPQKNQTGIVTFRFRLE